MTGGPPSRGDCWHKIGISGDRSCPELVQFIHCRNCPVFASAARSFFDRPAPAGYLAQWNGLLAGAQPPVPSDKESVSVLVFRLSGEWFAIVTKVVVEVTSVRPVHRIPHRSNQVLRGMVNLGGQLHLCVSLHGLFSIEPLAGDGDLPPTSRMIVIRQNNEPWVFTAEEAPGVHRVPHGQLRNVPSTLAQPAVNFSQGVFSREGRSVGYLDEQRVFTGLRSMGL